MLTVRTLALTLVDGPDPFLACVERPRRLDAAMPDRQMQWESLLSGLLVEGYRYADR
jgi:hypothetical protein